ncbi:MAG: hypothetical protein L3J33_03445 [Rhodobacteraceae bacterium]|nr:hypothetical protein [Paracoccaceae bacterium]
MPTYPLAFPASPNIQSLSIRPLRSVGATQSPYDLSQQKFDHGGALWVGEVTIPPMKYTAAGAWEVFILQCRGKFGTFLMGPPLARPTGTGTTADMQTAGAAGDESIVLQNAGNALTFKLGNWLQIGTGTSSRLHKITADATSSAGGTVTLAIEPALKEAYPISVAVTVSSPVGVWSLATNEAGWDINQMASFGVSFSIMEAL